MKSFTAIVALSLLATAHAQSACAPLAAKIPSCATECIASAAAGVGCSGVTDFACQCKNTEAINAAALNCVLKGCGAQTGLAVQASASAVCDCVATAGSDSKPTSAPASSPAAVQSGHGPVETKASSPATASSAAAVPTSTAAPYPTASAQASQISDGQVQASGAASASTFPSSSVVPFTGAGVRTVASVGGILVAFGAAVVAL